MVHESLVIDDLEAEVGRLRERLARSEQLNAELARMLAAIEWVDSECPDCGERRFSGHAPGCALAALLKKARTE